MYEKQFPKEKIQKMLNFIDGIISLAPDVEQKIFDEIIEESGEIIEVREPIGGYALPIIFTGDKKD